MLIDLDGAVWLWIRALHIIGFIAWMAGQLYLPRLFVYHSMEDPGSAAAETFKIMERRLINAIMTPAMLFTTVFGLILLANLEVEAWFTAWLWIKLICVSGLFVTHFLGMKWRRDFCANRNRRSPMFYRVANEIPTVFMIILVVFVVIRPF